MTAIFERGVLKATCPECGTLANFDQTGNGHAIGGPTVFNGVTYSLRTFRMMKCTGCGRAGMAEFASNANFSGAVLVTFFPHAGRRASLPTATPPEVQAEFREAERCDGAGAYRAAAAMLRSALEKVLVANGYSERDLKTKIDAAAADGVITEARKNRAQQEVRVLGNDVVHDPWCAFAPDDIEQSHHYVQRVIADFYDDRATVEAMLRAKQRIQ